jgi:hypothetical protein
MFFVLDQVKLMGTYDNFMNIQNIEYKHRFNSAY